MPILCKELNISTSITGGGDSNTSDGEPGSEAAVNLNPLISIEQLEKLIREILEEEQNKKRW